MYVGRTLGVGVEISSPTSCPPKSFCICLARRRMWESTTTEIIPLHLNLPPKSGARQFFNQPFFPYHETTPKESEISIPPIILYYLHAGKRKTQNCHLPQHPPPFLLHSIIHSLHHEAINTSLHREFLVIISSPAVLQQLSFSFRLT